MTRKYSPDVLLRGGFRVLGGTVMPKDRAKTRANRRREQVLDRKNLYGADDPTPQAAVERIRRRERIEAVQVVRTKHDDAEAVK